MRSVSEIGERDRSTSDVVKSFTKIRVNVLFAIEEMESMKRKKKKIKLEKKKRIPVPMLSLHESTNRRCLAAFLTLSPLALRNLSTHASLQYFSCTSGNSNSKTRNREKRRRKEKKSEEKMFRHCWCLYLLHGEGSLFPKELENCLYKLSVSGIFLLHLHSHLQ